MGSNPISSTVCPQASYFDLWSPSSKKASKIVSFALITVYKAKRLLHYVKLWSPEDDCLACNVATKTNSQTTSFPGSRARAARMRSWGSSSDVPDRASLFFPRSPRKTESFLLFYL